MRGRRNGVIIRAPMAISKAMSRLSVVIAKVSAEKNHATKAESIAKGQLKRIHAQEYASQKVSRQAVAEIADVAVNVANSGPCSIAMKITIGPATTGKALIKPAMLEPHLRPTKVIKPINKGTIVSLRISNTK
jgi:hypothetical protein